MMSNSAVTRDVPESLFSDEEVPRKKKSKKEDASPEFMKLVKTVGAKVQRREERRRKRPKTIAASSFERARQDVVEMIESSDWSECGARHLVALYDLMHTKCYGVEPSMGSGDRYNATMMAANLVKREFDGDYVKAVQFMRWKWTGEIRQEKWRRENNKLHARRVGVRLMFSPDLVSDYRVFLARSSHRS